MSVLGATALRTTLGVGRRTLERWMAADPHFPAPVTEDGQRRPQWDANEINRYRKTIVRAAEVEKILGISTATLYARRRFDPNFPQAIVTGSGHSPALWRRTAIEAYSKTPAPAPQQTPAHKAPKAVTFAQFATIMGITPQALHYQQRTDPAFPPPITSGRGALWARVDADTYRGHRISGTELPPWRKHTDPDLDLVTLTEFAELLGVTANTLISYKAHRVTDFPTPALRTRYPVWRRTDAQAFAASWKARQNTPSTTPK